MSQGFVSAFGSCMGGEFFDVDEFDVCECEGGVSCNVLLDESSCAFVVGESGDCVDVVVVGVGLEHAVYAL